MASAQVAVLTDQSPSRPEGLDRGESEIWSGETDSPEFATRTLAEGSYLAAPCWPALPPLSMAATYALLLSLGVLGAHQFYLRNWWRAGLYLVTAGGLGIGLIVDLLTIRRQLEGINSLRALGLR